MIYIDISVLFILGLSRCSAALFGLITLEENGFWIKFPFISEVIKLTETKGGIEGSEDQGTTQETTQEAAQETTQEIILSLVKDKPTITRREIASHIGLTDDGVKYHLTKMRKAGLIQHRGATKAGHWEVLK